MREHRYRAWAKEYSTAPFKMYYFGCPEFEILRYTEYGLQAGYYDSDGHFESLYDLTLIQSTGLRDKNGKEIYEGDILKVIQFEPPWECVASVKFSERCASFKIGTEWNDMFLWYANEEGDLEITGNIFENPELLKGGEG